MLPDDLDEIEGERTEDRYDADIGFTLFPEAPSSYGVRFIGTRIDYSNEEATTGAPQQAVEGQAFWRLRLNPVLSSELLGSYLFYKADDAVDTEIRIAEVTFGLIYERSESLTVGAGLGYADREREELEAACAETTEYGPGAGADAATSATSCPTSRSPPTAS